MRDFREAGPFYYPPPQIREQPEKTQSNRSLILNLALAYIKQSFQVTSANLLMYN